MYDCAYITENPIPADGLVPWQKPYMSSLWIIFNNLQRLYVEESFKQNVTPYFIFSMQCTNDCARSSMQMDGVYM